MPILGVMSSACTVLNDTPLAQHTIETVSVQPAVSSHSHDVASVKSISEDTPCSAPSAETENPCTPQNPQHDSRTITSDEKGGLEIALVGDMMLGTNYPEDLLPEDDGEQLLKAVLPHLRNADITFGNLEGVLSDEGEPRKICHIPQNCYLFKTPRRYVRHFLDAGFDVISLANNHARDFGEEGRSQSMLTLDKAGIRHSGRHGDVASWKVRGMRIALIAFAPFIGSHDLLDEDTAADLVRELAKTHDVILVSMHAGAEGLDAAHLPFKQEIYRGEDRGDVVRFAHAVIDAGADVVIGHGPHVPRAIEVYKGRIVAYSLGNFCTYWGISIDGAKGLAPIFKIRLAEDGEFLEGRIISARQQRPNGVVLDPEHGAAKMMAELTKTDFPGSPLIFFDDGRVRLRPAAEKVDSALARRVAR